MGRHSDIPWAQWGRGDMVSRGLHRGEHPLAGGLALAEGKITTFVFVRQ